jgi:hypothetical protein
MICRPCELDKPAADGPGSSVALSPASEVDGASTLRVRVEVVSSGPSVGFSLDIFQCTVAGYTNCILCGRG